MARIDINAPIESIEGKLSVSLRAGRDISVSAPITTNGGNYSAMVDPSLGDWSESEPESVEPITEGFESAEEASVHTGTESDPVLSESPSENSPTDGEQPLASEASSEANPGRSIGWWHFTAGRRLYEWW